MIEENIFIPRILLCGKREEFFSRVDRRPFEIVGQVEFSGEINGQEFNFLRDGKFLLNGKLVEHTELIRAFKERGIDFIVFNDDRNLKPLFVPLNRTGCPRSQLVTLREFNNLPLDGFYDMHSDMQLMTTLKNFSIKTLLDVNAHFLKSFMLTKNLNESLEIDCICQENFLPIKENLFRHVYKNFSDCALRHYDAALINEKSPTNFDKIFSRLQNTVDIVITFARYNSALEKHIRGNLETFKTVNVLPSFAGDWFFCHVKRPPEDFAMYVVTHKKLPAEHVDNLPEGYKVIHAGRAGKEDLGYTGDNTGDNISDLNPYLNEITALYWMWKNTSHTVVGLSHYRRFFSADGKNFLNAKEIFALLESYDIITYNILIHRAPSAEILRDDICDREVASFAENIVRKNLMRAQPDYLDVFNFKMNSPTNFYFNMFVARRPVFDAYCEWLFSFMIDSTREILNRTPLAELKPSERRLPGHFAERMMTVWLMKNRLRIKEMNVLQLQGL